MESAKSDQTLKEFIYSQSFNQPDSQTVPTFDTSKIFQPKVSSNILPGYHSFEYNNAPFNNRVSQPYQQANNDHFGNSNFQRHKFPFANHVTMNNDQYGFEPRYGQNDYGNHNFYYSDQFEPQQPKYQKRDYNDRKDFVPEKPEMKGMFAVIGDSLDNLANEIVQNQLAAEKKKTHRPHQSNFLDAKPKMTKARVAESGAKKVEDAEQVKEESEEESVESEKEPENIWADPDIFNRPRQLKKETPKVKQPTPVVKDQIEEPKPVSKGKPKEEKKVYEESDELKQWRALPRSQRDRFTKKQIAMMNKPDLASETLIPEFK